MYSDFFNFGFQEAPRTGLNCLVLDDRAIFASSLKTGMFLNQTNFGQFKNRTDQEFGSLLYRASKSPADSDKKLVSLITLNILSNNFVYQLIPVSINHSEKQ